MNKILIPVLGALLFVGCPAEDTPTAKPAPTTPKTNPASQPASQPKPTKVGKGTTPADRDQVDADGVVRRGIKMSTSQTITVADAAKKAAELNGKPVKLAGTVEKVCAKKGCWFTLKEGDHSVRITMKDYGFFVPKNAAGKKALVEGILEVKEMSLEETKHMAEDSGKDASKITEPATELRLESTSLELRG